MCELLRELGVDIKLVLNSTRPDLQLGNNCKKMHYLIFDYTILRMFKMPLTLIHTDVISAFEALILDLLIVHKNYERYNVGCPIK